MFDRTGWFGAALFAAALAAAGAGCSSPETTEGGTPPPEQGTGTEPGGTPVAGGEEHPTGGGETAGGHGEHAGGGGEMAPAPAGGGESTQPAGAGMQGTAPAADANTITLEASIGADRQPAVKMMAGGQDGGSVAMKEGEVPQPLVDQLKAKREAMMAAGQQPRVVVTGPLDVPFDTVVIPVMKAAFRAGFQRSEVEYKPPSK